MKVLALISGGKDSCYCMMQCISEGHTIVALANLKPDKKDELDSYMYQTVGHHAIDLYSQALGLPLYRRTITGTSVQTGATYSQTKDDEVEDLYLLLKMIMEQHDVDAVCSGAIMSDYQRVRVESVCSRLGLVSLAYLWRRDQEELLKEMIDCEVNAIIIKVAALGLDPNKHLGKSLAEMQDHMKSMREKFGLNICGEGGEFETFTLDCPLFDKKIVIDKSQSILHSDDAFAPVAYLNLVDLHLEDKPKEFCAQSWSDRLKPLPLKRSSNLLAELDLLDVDGGNEPVQESAATCRAVPAISEGDLSMLSGEACIRIRRLQQGFTTISGIYAGLTANHTPTSATRVAMDKLKCALQTQSLHGRDVATVALYVYDMSYFAEINSVYKQYFDINPPIRVCVQVALPLGVLFVLDCTVHNTAAIADEPCPDNEVPNEPCQRKTMHVQSISHWAAANIGPYSQAVQIGSLLYVAGQIALCPADSTVITSGFHSECSLSLRHTKLIHSAMSSTCTVKQCLLVICYVTEKTNIRTARQYYNNTFQNQDMTAEVIEAFVVVPGLPRGAKIEWQVYSRGDREDADCTHKHISYTHSNTTAEMTYTHVCTDAAINSPQSFSFRILIRNSDVNSVACETLADLLAGCFNKLPTSCLSNGSVPFVQTIKLFYLADLWPLHMVEQVLGPISSSLSLPSITVVPVTGLEQDDCVAVFCC